MVSTIHCFNRWTIALAKKRLLNLSGWILLSVGHFIKRRGRYIAMKKVSKLGNVQLAVTGDGPLDEDLRAFASRVGVSDRARFEGAVLHDELVYYYKSADTLLLCCSR